MKLFHPLAASLALRCIFSGRNHRFASFVALLAVLGTAIGVCALITVSSVMQSLQGRLSDSLLSTAPHVVVSAPQDKIPSLLGISHVQAAGPFVSGRVIAQSRRGMGLVNLMGYDPELVQFKKGAPAPAILEVPPKGSFAIKAGAALYDRFSLEPGDSIRLVSTINARYTPAGLTPVRRTFALEGYLPSLRTSGVIDAVANLDDARRLLRIPPEQFRIRLWLDSPFNADAVERELDAMGLAHEDWRQSQGEFFRSVAMERLSMMVMLFLIVIAAAFNILSALAMTVSARIREIAVLKTMGMRSSGVVGIFTAEGLILGGAGCILGVIGGVLLATHSGTLLWLLGVPSGRTLEVSANPGTVALIALLSLFLCVLCTLYPAMKAAKADPASSLASE
ncbi:MAG: FtsX-like permease family protein [Succinivibrio sp.]